MGAVLGYGDTPIALDPAISMQDTFCQAIRLVVMLQLLALGTFGRRISLIYHRV